MNDGDFVPRDIIDYDISVMVDAVWWIVQENYVSATECRFHGLAAKCISMVLKSHETGHTPQDHNNRGRSIADYLSSIE
jgi:hypothetical protein